MLSKTVSVISFFLLISCVGHEYVNTSPKFALSTGSLICGKSKDDMEWLKTLLQQAETDAGLRGDIYATSIDGRVIFIHQPLIMGCLACVLYDCDGNRIPPEELDHEKLREGMHSANLIFKLF